MSFLTRFRNGNEKTVHKYDIIRILCTDIYLSILKTYAGVIRLHSAERPLNNKQLLLVGGGGGSTGGLPDGDGVAVANFVHFEFPYVPSPETAPSRVRVISIVSGSPLPEINIIVAAAIPHRRRHTRRSYFVVLNSE